MQAFFIRFLKRIPGVKYLYRRLMLFSARSVRPLVNKFITQKVLGISKELPVRQVYFSMYEIWPLAPARWVRNEQPWFKSKLTESLPDMELVHFLGAPLVERDGIGEAAYLEWLRNLIAYYEGKRFVYILHPRESNEWGQKLSRLLRIPVIRQKLPYEIELCMMPKRPHVVASWFCSALDNLGNCAIANLELVAYRLPKVQLAADKQRQGKILEAAELFYRRHAGGDKVSVREIPGAKREVSLRPSTVALRQFVNALPVVMVELRVFAQQRILLGHAVEGEGKRRLALPMDFWLKDESIHEAASRLAVALLGDTAVESKCIAGGCSVREAITADSQTAVQLVYDFELRLAEPVPVNRQLGYDSFEWWAPATALSAPILGTQARLVLEALSSQVDA